MTTHNTESKLSLPSLRILVVEDDVPTAAQLAKSIEDGFENDYHLAIDTAHSRESAHSHLSAISSESSLYHVVILDYKIPDKDGGNPTVSLELASYILEHPTLARILIQWSAYTNDKPLQDFWQECAKQGFANGELLSKGDPIGTTRLLDAIGTKTQRLFSREIARVLSSEEFERQVGRRPSVHSRLGTPHEPQLPQFTLNTFIERLSLVWPIIDQETQHLAHSLLDIAFLSGDDRCPNRITLKDFRRR